MGAGDIAVRQRQCRYVNRSTARPDRSTVFTAGDTRIPGTTAQFQNTTDPPGAATLRARDRHLKSRIQRGSGTTTTLVTKPDRPAQYYTTRWARGGSFRSTARFRPERALRKGNGFARTFHTTFSPHGCLLAPAFFSSGALGDNPDMRDLWRVLYEFGVDLVINGHDHLYERFAPQDPEGHADFAHGIREFIVGTGGAPLSGVSRMHTNSESRGVVWGVAVFTLFEHSYDWRFVPIGDGEFEDSGSSTCH